MGLLRDTIEATDESWGQGKWSCWRGEQGFLSGRRESAVDWPQRTTVVYCTACPAPLDPETELGSRSGDSARPHEVVFSTIVTRLLFAYSALFFDALLCSVDAIHDYNSAGVQRRLLPEDYTGSAKVYIVIFCPIFCPARQLGMRLSQLRFILGKH